MGGKCWADLLYVSLQRGVRLMKRGVESIVVVLTGSGQFALKNKQSKLIFDLKSISPFPENNLLRLAEGQPVNHVAAGSNQKIMLRDEPVAPVHPLACQKQTHDIIAAVASKRSGACVSDCPQS